MLGIPDPGIWLAFLLCILSAALCVIYGATHWNSDDEPMMPDPRDVKWREEEKQIEDEL